MSAHSSRTISSARVCFLPAHLGFFDHTIAHTPAEIAKRKRPRGIGDQIRFGHSIEAALAKHGAQARKILAERRKNAKPILAIVNFQAFERSKGIRWA